MTSHSRYIWLEQGAAASVINVLLNAGIAWVSYRAVETVPMWGMQGIAADVTATSFLLPAITCLIVTRLARHEVRKGRFPTIASNERTATPSLPRSVRGRAVVLGLVCLVIVAPLAIGILNVLGVAGMPFQSFVLFKAIFAGCFALVVTPFIAWAGLRDVPDPRSAG